LVVRPGVALSAETFGTASRVDWYSGRAAEQNRWTRAAGNENSNFEVRISKFYPRRRVNSNVRHLDMKGKLLCDEWLFSWLSEFWC
jgi:hypothetical protein